MPAAERDALQEQLIDIILEVLKRNPQLHYYQGYHDVAVSLLLVVGEKMAIAMLETLSKYHLRLYKVVPVLEIERGSRFECICLCLRSTGILWILPWTAPNTF